MRIPVILLAGLCLVLTRTSALAQIYVKNPGNVGIGISTPASKFHVSGKSLFESTDDVINLSSSNAASWQYITFNKSGTRRAWAGLNGANDFHIKIEQPGHLFLLPTNGRVIIESNQDNGNIGAALTLRHAGKTGAGQVTEWSLYNMTAAYGSNSLQFWGYTSSAAFSALTLGDNGNVGIGLTNPGYKLHVDGVVKATSFTSSGTDHWPDYVFAANYQLPSLRELENYIKQYHHLPEVPSAEEVKKDGVDLTSNQAILLKKIEELTLYVIEQEKKQQKLEESVEMLKEENVRLNELLKKIAVEKR